MEDSPLASRFPKLLNCAKDRNAKVIDYMDKNGSQISGCPIFRRKLMEHEERKLLDLLQLVGQMLISKEGKDCRIWVPNSSGSFSVFSFFLVLCSGWRGWVLYKKLWKLKISLRALVFGWLALMDSILAMDNLQKRRIIVVNACPMCLEMEGLVDPLLLNCSVKKMWWDFLNLFDCFWIFPKSLTDHFEVWALGVRTKRRKVMERCFLDSPVDHLEGAQR